MVRSRALRERLEPGAKARRRPFETGRVKKAASLQDEVRGEQMQFLNSSASAFPETVDAVTWGLSRHTRLSRPARRGWRDNADHDVMRFKLIGTAQLSTPQEPT